MLIHDAARPLISAKVIGAVVKALEAGADGALPMVAAADTLRRRDADGRWSLVSRENLIAPRRRKASSMPRSSRRIAPMPAKTSPTTSPWRSLQD